MSDTPSDADPLLKYHQFIGWFVTQFAALEFHFRRLLQIHSGLDPDTFEILIGVPRSGEATSKLQKLIQRLALDDLARTEINEAMRQLQSVTKLRDWIVHYGGHPIEGDRMLVRLRPTETSTATGKSYHIFTRQELWYAAIDAQLIQQRLLRHLDTSLPTYLMPPPEKDGANKQPWRYIPPQLIQRPK